MERNPWITDDQLEIAASSLAFVAASTDVDPKDRIAAAQILLSHAHLYEYPPAEILPSGDDAADAELAGGAENQVGPAK